MVENERSALDGCAVMEGGGAGYWTQVRVAQAVWREASRC